MAAELQGLLERIQKDGIEKAEAEAGTIVSKAQDKAAGLIKDAESKAKSILENADKDSQAFEARARKALEQAARDAVLSVHEAINATMKKIAAAEVDTIMSGSALEEMLTAVVRAYCENKGGASSIEILINPDQQKDLQNFFTAKFATEIERGNGDQGGRQYHLRIQGLAQG